MVGTGAWQQNNMTPDIDKLEVIEQLIELFSIQATLPVANGK
jgi:hypothetical protein